MELVVGTMFSYWLSWFLCPSGPKDGINSFVFPIGIHLVKGENLAQAPIYLKSLYARLDECINNVLRLV